MVHDQAPFRAEWFGRFHIPQGLARPDARIVFLMFCRATAYSGWRSIFPAASCNLLAQTQGESSSRGPMPTSSMQPLLRRRSSWSSSLSRLPQQMRKQAAWWQLRIRLPNQLKRLQQMRTARPRAGDGKLQQLRRLNLAPCSWPGLVALLKLLGLLGTRLGVQPLAVAAPWCLRWAVQ